MLAAGLSVFMSVVVVANSTDGTQDTAATNVCVFSRSEVFARSVVGKKANKRMQQVAQEARSAVAQGRKQLASDINAFSRQASTPPRQERQSQRRALRQRKNMLEQKTQRIEMRLRYTRDAVTKRISAQIDAALKDVYTQRDCSIVLKRDSVVFAGQADDLTATVTKAMNARVDMVNFGLLQLPRQSTAAVAANTTG